MSIQQRCMATASFATSRIVRCGTTANYGARSNSIFSGWNRKFENSLRQPIRSASVRSYAIPANYSQVTTTVSSRSHNNFLSLRDLASSVLSLVSGIPCPAILPPSIRGMTMARETTLSCSSSNSSSILSWAIWLIKRTYQPSLLKKKRQCGYMKRRQSVGGRRILKRRRKKGRKRLFGA